MFNYNKILESINDTDVLIGIVQKQCTCAVLPKNVENNGHVVSGNYDLILTQFKDIFKLGTKFRLTYNLTEDELIKKIDLAFDQLTSKLIL